MTDTAQTLGSYRDAPDDIKEAAASIAAWTGLTNEAAERSLVEGAAAAALFIERNRNAAEITRLTAEVERLTKEREIHSTSDALGKWMSAALDDPSVCAEMKADINAWFAAAQPLPQPTDNFDTVAARAWDFVRPKLLYLSREKGPAGVWSNGFRSGWTHALSAAALRTRTTEAQEG